QTVGQPISRAELLGELLAEIETLADERSIIEALSRYRQRHLLRIAHSEIAGHADLEVVQSQLSHLAEALIEAALAPTLRKAEEARPLSRRMAQRPLRCAVIAVGQL